MHHVITLLIRENDPKEAKQIAESIIEDRLITGSGYDWYQGVKESERWPEFERFDQPVLVDEEIKKHLIKSVDLTIKTAHEWIKKGINELKEKGDHDLGWTLANFSLAASETQCDVFDGDGEPIQDQEHLNRVLDNWGKQTTIPLYAVCFDMHH